MRAAVLRQGRVEIRTIEDPVPGPGQVLGTRVSSRPVMFAGGGMKIIGQNPETPGAFGEYLLLYETLMKVVSSDLPSEVVCISDAIGVGGTAGTGRSHRDSAGDRLRCHRAGGDRDAQAFRGRPDSGGRFRCLAPATGARDGRRRGDRSG